MFARFLERRSGAVYAALRIAAGLMFAFHGFQLLFGVLTDRPAPEPGTQIWFGKIIELTTGVAMALGLLTRWAAFLASGTMLVAYLQFHWKFQLDENLLPAVNQGELALLYSGLFLYFACRGGGRFAVDSLVFRSPGGSAAG